MKEWRLITKRTISEETSRIDITTDDDGKSFSCSELIIAVNLKADKDGVVPTSGTVEIIIPSDGTLYVGVGSNANVAHGGYKVSCFDGDYIKIKKAR